jgi:hypothetical protein
MSNRSKVNAERLAMRRTIIRSHGSAWPGGYPMIAVMDDGEVLCHKCCSSPEVYRSTRDGDRDGWTLVSIECHMEGPAHWCSHCNAEIESAYGDPDAEE